MADCRRSAPEGARSVEIGPSDGGQHRKRAKSSRRLGAKSEGLGSTEEIVTRRVVAAMLRLQLLTGMRPGERLNEILFDRIEENSDIGIAGVVAARPVSPAVDVMRAWIAMLEQGLAREEREAIYRVLRDAVPDFRGEAA